MFGTRAEGTQWRTADASNCQQPQHAKNPASFAKAIAIAIVIERVGIGIRLPFAVFLEGERNSVAESLVRNRLKRITAVVNQPESPSLPLTSLMLLRPSFDTHGIARVSAPHRPSASIRIGYHHPPYGSVSGTKPIPIATAPFKNLNCWCRKCFQHHFFESADLFDTHAVFISHHDERQRLATFFRSIGQVSSPHIRRTSLLYRLSLAIACFQQKHLTPSRFRECTNLSTITYIDRFG